MNFKTGLKTMAVALPLAVTPVKSSAQQVVKEVSHKAATEVNARAGIAYGRTAYFGHMNYEPKLAGSLSVRAKNIVAGADVLAGKSNQEYKAFAGIPVIKGKAGYVDFGAVGRYQHNTESATRGVILSPEVYTKTGDYADNVELNRSKGFVGAYIAPTLKVGQVNITPHAEAGVGFVAGPKFNVAKADIPEVIRDERMVNRAGSKFSTNVGLTIDAALDSGVRAGLEGNYSSYDRSTNVLAKFTYELDRLFKKH